MGKPTGFMEYTRLNNASLSPEERLQNYNEFHPPMAYAERRLQGARCMNCGVPFCQSAMKLNGMVTGCPLHNLIPEWNDEIYHGNPSYGLKRLLKTNPFPEFTGRVCPALCEKACICGMNDDPVTIRENELFLIEHGFEQNDMTPHPPKVRTGKKVAVIGSGPSGLSVAERLNARGHFVTVFEKNDRPGGLLMYGIPNMKLEKNIVDRRIRLQEEEGVVFLLNSEIKDKKQAQKLLSDFDAIVLCAGAGKPRDLSVPGRDGDGVYFAVDFLTSTTKSLLNSNLKKHDYLSASGKHVFIVGGGDTGNDCVGTCLRHGAKSVTQLEMMPKPPGERLPSNPWPQWPKTLKTDYGQEEAIFRFGEDPRIYETTIKTIHRNASGKMTGVETVKVAFENGTLKEVPGTEQTHKADLILIAAGFLGCMNNLPEAFGIKPGPRGNLLTTDGSYRTEIPKVFTAGDMHRGQSLVVWAIAEGCACATEVDAFLMGYTNME